MPLIWWQPMLVLQLLCVCLFMCLLRWWAENDAYLHLLHLLGFSPLCIAICLLILCAFVDANVHWLHLFGFSPLCVFIRIFRLSALNEAKSHLSRLFGINLTTNRDVVLKNQAASPRPKAEDWQPGFLRPHRDW